MKNYIVINGQSIELTEEQAERIKASFRKKHVKISDVAAGDTVMIGSHEMIVLEHVDDTTLLLRKDPLEKMVFGENNNYDGSAAEKVCNRAMSDEELYAWAKKQIGCGFDFFPCGVVCEGKCESYSDEECKSKIMEWLQQPAKENDDG